MPKPTKGPRLGGSPAHERLIIKNLCKQIVRHGEVTTTVARAKRVRPVIERLITKAKRGDTHNRRQILKVVGERELAYILIEELAPKFAERNGGYTRTIKLGNRRGDNAPMVQISLVLEPVQAKKPSVKKEAPAKVEEKVEEVVEEPAAEETVEEVVEEAEAVEAEAPEAEAPEAEEK